MGPVLPRPYDGEAYNQATASDNRIHSDEVARQYGFEGALVPGVTVSSYLIHPAVEAWGADWLARGQASIVVKKPLYDRRGFRVDVRGATDTSYDADLTDSTGTLCATAAVKLPGETGTPPVRRDDAPIADRVPATREGIELLRERGMGAMKAVWDEGVPMTTYFRDASRMPEILRLDGGGYANSAFLLGLTNHVFAANVALGPWVHLQTDSQHFAPVPRGSEIIVQARVLELFEKKGHEFVDVDVAAFFANDAPIMAVRLRAIYKLRGG